MYWLHVLHMTCVSISTSTCMQHPCTMSYSLPSGCSGGVRGITRLREKKDLHTYLNREGEWIPCDMLLYMCLYVHTHTHLQFSVVLDGVGEFNQPFKGPDQIYPHTLNDNSRYLQHYCKCIHGCFSAIELARFSLGSHTHISHPH